MKNAANTALASYGVFLFFKHIENKQGMMSVDEMNCNSLEIPKKK